MQSSSKEQTASQARRKYPGILSLIISDASTLLYYPYNKQDLENSTSILRKSKRPRFGKDQDKLSSNPLDVESMISAGTDPISYDPDLTEWSLLFVASSKNLNSIRFRPILVKFCNENATTVQCICVTNDECNIDDEDAISIKCRPKRRSKLLCGTGFFELTWDHPHRDAILHLLGVTKVPTVVVVSNRDGRRCTDRGMEDIESSISIDDLLDRWRNPSSSWDISNCQVL
jgi:hypothetical protein